MIVARSYKRTLLIFHEPEFRFKKVYLNESIAKAISSCRIIIHYFFQYKK